MRLNKRTIVLSTVVAVMAFSAVFVASAQPGGRGGRGTPAQPGAQMQFQMGGQAFIGIAYELADTGVTVTEVVAESPAELAGLQVGDVITAINDISLVGGNRLRRVVNAFDAGDVITLSVTRGEEALSVELTLGEAPTALQFGDILPGQGLHQMRLEGRPHLGVALEATEDNTGAAVTTVIAGSPAETAGLLVGDVITAVNGTAVTTPAEAVTAVTTVIHEAASAEEPAETLALTVSVLRDGATVDLSADIAVPTQPGLGLGFGLDDLPGMRDMRGMGGMMTPREDGSGFDLSLAITVPDSAVVTEEVIAALQSLGITIIAREGEEGVYDLVVPSEALSELNAGGMMLGRGMDFGGHHFQMPGMPGRGGQGQQQDPGMTVPASQL